MEHKNYINILLQDLKKKNQVLDNIIQANQKQKDALEDPNLDPDDFEEILEEKAKLIEQLNQLDDGFEQVYARVREELQEHKELYRDNIKEMQDLIRQLTEKSATIQAEEQRNKALMTQKFAAVKKQIREIRSSQKVVNQYYKNMMKKDTVEPQFMDNKKVKYFCGFCDKINLKGLAGTPGDSYGEQKSRTVRSIRNTCRI